MKKIMIIGCPGSGKSTLAKEMSELLDLSVVHLDKLYWNSGWIESSDEIFDLKLQQVLNEKSWIIDGNYGRTIPLRLKYADTVILLDYPKYICMYRVIKRVISDYGKTRSDMADGCPERFDIEFLKYVWNFNKNKQKVLLEKISSAKDKEIFVIRNKKDRKKLLLYIKRELL